MRLKVSNTAEAVQAVAVSNPSPFLKYFRGGSAVSIKHVPERANKEFCPAIFAPFLRQGEKEKSPSMTERALEVWQLAASARSRVKFNGGQIKTNKKKAGFRSHF